MTDAINHCEACRWWVPIEDEDGHRLGQCRRFPPSYEGWPMTDAMDWCGEYMDDSAT